MTDQDLDKKIENLKAEHAAEKNILEHLKLPDYTRHSICRHFNRTSQKHFWSVSISNNQPCGGIPFERVLEIVEQHKAQIVVAPFYKQPVFLASWGPIEANHSYGERGATHEGEAQIEVEQSGGVRFCTRRVSFWLQVPDTGFAELGIEVQNLPSGYQVHGHTRRFDPESGESLGVVMSGPKIPGGATRTGMGSPGSWDHRRYWKTAQEFIEAMRSNLA